jgi:hypothetical protein
MSVPTTRSSTRHREGLPTCTLPGAFLGALLLTPGYTATSLGVLTTCPPALEEGEG